MDKHGSSSSLSINMETGVEEPFQVTLQLSCLDIFFWGEGPELSSDPQRFVTLGSLRGTDLFSDQMHVC